MKLPKLIRDKLTDKFIRRGINYKVSYISGEEYIQALDAKLDEEVAEFKADHSLEELADILEVLLAATRAHGYSVDELLLARGEKALELGGFLLGCRLDEIEEEKGNEMCVL